MRRANLESTRPAIPWRIGLSAALLVAFLALVLTACGSSNDADPAEGGNSESVPAAQTEVDEVTWNLAFGEPPSLDPILSWNNSENQVLANMCEQLFRVGPNFEIEPWLAESFSHPAPKEWVYAIRDDVTFWNGDPLTAEDVAFSLRRHTEESNNSFYYATLGSEISDVSVTGPNEVTVTTKRPNFLVHEMMASGLSVVGQADYIKKQGGDYGKPAGELMCTGPFEFDRWQPGREITMVRNEDYWDSENAAKAERFRFTFIDDATTFTNALLSGEVDGGYDIPPDSLEQLRSSEAVNVYTGASTNLLSLAPTGTPKLEPLELRQALSLAIDREQLAEVIFPGAAESLKSGALLPIPYSYAPDVFEEAYEEMPSLEADREQAKELVSEAGAPAEPIVMGFQSGDPASAQMANLVVDAGQEIGLDVETLQLTAGEYLNLYFDPVAREEMDMFISSQTWIDVADPLQKIMFNNLPTSQLNLSDYDNDRVTDAYYEALAEDDPNQRAEIVLEAVEQINEDLPEIPLLYLPTRLALNSALGGPAPSFPYYMHYPWAATVGGV